MEEISLYGPNGKPNWFWELNPKGEVPVVVVSDDVVLADSDLILTEMGKQVAVAESSPLSSSDTNPKKAQQIQTFRKVLREFLPIGKSAVLGGSKDKMWKKLQELDALIVGPYVCGEDITIADCAAFPFLWRVDQEYGLSGKCDNLASWVATCQAHSAFSKTVQRSWWWWW